MNTRILFSLSAVTLLAATASAQTPGAIENVDALQHQRSLAQSATGGDESAPELYAGESGDVGPQSVLRVKPRRSWFEAMVDAQFFYTDNMFLSQNNAIDTGVLVSTAQVAVAPTAYELPCGSLLAPRVGYRHQWFDFGLDGKTLPSSTTKLSDFDFNVETIFSDVTVTHGKWSALLGFDYQRLLTTSGYSEFYHERVLRWGVSREIPVCDRSTLVVGYEGDFRGTDSRSIVDPDFNDRMNQGVFATYNIAPCEHAVIQPYYRFKFTHFTHFPGGPRNDYLNSFGVAVYWVVCKHANVRAFVGYDIKNSDSPFVSEYSRLDAGGGVNVSIRF